jgi:hypothetical protein
MAGAEPDQQGGGGDIGFKGLDFFALKSFEKL